MSYGPNAEDMLGERNISREWVEATVLRPDFIELDPVHLDRRRAFRAIPERDGRILRVAYADGESPHVVTFFFDRARTRQHAKPLRS